MTQEESFSVDSKFMGLKAILKKGKLNATQVTQPHLYFVKRIIKTLQNLNSLILKIPGNGETFLKTNRPIISNDNPHNCIQFLTQAFSLSSQSYFNFSSLNPVPSPIPSLISLKNSGLHTQAGPQFSSSLRQKIGVFSQCKIRVLR